MYAAAMRRKTAEFYAVVVISVYAQLANIIRLRFGSTNCVGSSIAFLFRTTVHLPSYINEAGSKTVALMQTWNSLAPLLAITLRPKSRY